MTPDPRLAEPDPEDDVQIHDSPVVRAALTVSGVIFVFLGMVGVLLPVVPTVPFLLVAAACFARASPRFYRMLVTSKAFGPAILEWRRHRSIPWRTKLIAMVLLFVSLGSSILLFVRPLWLQLAVGAIGLAVLVYMWRIPSRDRPRAGR
jgi:uncharacterized membrane protein YbaN (DUF454 family)